MGRDLLTAAPQEALRRTELAQHCRRVAAWAVELARKRGMSPPEMERLRAAALAHHYPAILLDAGAKPRLLAALCLLESSGPPPLADDIAEVLRRMHRPDGRRTGVAALASLLEMADALDEWLEFEPVRAADDDPAPGGLAGEAAAALRAVDNVAASDVLNHLPVIPAVAQQVLAAFRSDHWSASRIEALAASDPVLAGHVIQCANTCAFGSRQPITTISRALLQIGETVARRVLVAACLRPAFASPPLYQLWNHSLGVAEAAEHIAGACGRCDPGEAFLAGLVHDIGRLALLRFKGDFQIRLARLLEQGCDSVSAEQVLCGMSHADIGALITHKWRFPLPMTQAVRNHHRPETRDPLAAVLYLAEACADSNEDRLSTLRRHYAFATLGMTPEDLAGVDPGSSNDLNVLKFAA